MESIVEAAPLPIPIASPTSCVVLRRTLNCVALTPAPNPEPVSRAAVVRRFTVLSRRF